MTIYALYKGDKFIDLGTREHLAKLLGVNKKTISHYSSPAYQRRNNYNGWVVIRIEAE